MSEAEPIVPASAITIPALNVAAPASLPSRVSIVISEVASVPLKIISLLFAAASIVMLPELVVIVTAASPVPKSSAATLLAETFSKAGGLPAPVEVRT